MEAYILSEMTGSDVTIFEYEYDEEGHLIIDFNINIESTEIGHCDNGYGDEEDTTVYLTNIQTETETVSIEEADSMMSKATSASWDVDLEAGTATRTYTTSDAYVDNPTGEGGYARVKTFHLGGHIQYDWWATVAGGHTSIGGSLATEARLFASYRAKIEGDYHPQWIVDGDCKDVYVYKNIEEGYSSIGPLAIDYIEAHAHVSGRPYVQFAGIVNVDVILDNGEILKLGKGFEFEWLEGERSAEDMKDYKFPKPDEKFNIRLTSETDATKIVDIRVDFRWMSAAGRYENLTGTYNLLYYVAKDRSARLSAVELEFKERAGRYDLTSLESVQQFLSEPILGYGPFAPMVFTGLDGVVRDYSTPFQKAFEEAGITGLDYVWAKQDGKLSGYMYDGEFYTKLPEGVKEDDCTKVYEQEYYFKAINNKIYLFAVSIERTKVAEKHSQNLSWGYSGERYYEFCELHRKIDYKTGTIAVHKDVVDEEGNNINELVSDAVFGVSVTASNCQNPYTETVYVRPGQTVEAPIVYWDANGSEPSFSANEPVIPDGYELVSIEPSSGTIPDTGTRAVVINVTNMVKKPKTAKLQIEKRIAETVYSENIPEEVKLEGKTFIFKVKLNGTFKYEGKFYKNTTCEFDVPVEAGGTPWESGEIKWYGEEAPAYSVEEIKVEGLKIKDISGERNWIDAPNPTPGNAFDLISIINDSGTLVEDVTTKVEAVNGYKIERASLGISKGLRITQNIQGALRNAAIEYAKTQKFVFDISIDGYEDDERTIRSRKITRRDSSVDGAIDYEWKYTSEPIVWVYGNNPKFRVYEDPTKNPENIKFDKETTSASRKNQEIPDIQVSDNEISGYLRQDDNIEETLVLTEPWNVIDNFEPVSGKISVQKIVDDSRASEAKLHGKSYPVIVLLSGKFIYQEKEYDTTESIDKKIQIISTDEGYKAVEIEGEEYNTNYILLDIPEGDPGITSSAKWTSDEITWFDKNDSDPEYEVKEVIQGIPVTSYNIVPESGSIVEGQTIDVKINNIYEDDIITIKKGYIKLYKEVDNIDICTPEYINSLKFEFDLNVKYDAASGKEDDNIIVVLDKDNYDSENHRWESDVYEVVWKDEEENPYYKITERNLPEGMVVGEEEKCEGHIEASVFTKEKIGPNGEVVEDETTGEPVIEIVDTNSMMEASIINQLESTSGQIEIKKAITNGAIEGKEFKFEVTIRGKFKYGGGEPESEKTINVTVRPSAPWTSETIEWAGDDAPEYVIKEIVPKKGEEGYTESKQDSSYLSTGTLRKGKTVKTLFGNKPEFEEDGFIEIKKVFAGDVFNYNKTFVFDVTVNNFRDENGDLASKTYTVTTQGDRKVQVGPFKWLESDGAPTYTVVETNGSASISGGSGSLSANTVVEAIAENTITGPKEGNINIKKEVIANKYSEAPAASFSMTVMVSGKFKYGGEYFDGSKTFNISLAGGESTSFGPFEWWGNEAPVVRVIEDISASPFPDDSWWSYIDTSNNGASLVDGATVNLVVTNQWDPQPEYDLTLRLAGQVWEDEDQDSESKNSSNTGLGKIDSEEHGIAGVEVYIKNAAGGNAEVFANLTNAPLKQPIITDGSGYWETPRIKMKRGDRYYVEFVYDGQTYKPTDYLVSGSAASYMSSKSSEYFDNSMALDIDRDEVNARLEKFKGGTPINGNGETLGKAEGSTREVDLHYKSKVGDPYAGNTRIASRLQTLKADGRPYDVFKAKAQTVELQYPFDDQITLASVSNTVSSETSITRVKTKYTYEATYPYCLHINLGLVKRKEADLGVTKYLEEAKVTLRDQEPFTYKFNTLADVTGQYYERQLEKDDAKQEFTLGLYNTGYYYRAEMYQTNSEIYDAIVNSNTGIPDHEALKNTELEVELKYKIVVYNESPTYDVEVHSINDYAERSLGMPIKTEIGGSGSSEWANKGFITASDSTEYRKLNLDLSGRKLGPGENVTVEVTFKVNKKTIEGVKDAVIDGQKSNIVEIESYSTYEDGKIAGKVDRDSAPDNINIRQYNNINMYEDDTDFAPPLIIKIIKDTKSVVGTVWEDSKKENESNGDGEMDSDSEARIAGLTTELVEIIKGYDENNQEHEYEFLWPTSTPMDSLGGKTVKDVSGFDSTIETATKEILDKQDPEAEDNLQAGDYRFEGIPSGNFRVKFLYGNNKMELEDTIGISGPAYAAKPDGTYYNAAFNLEGKEHRILVANYDEESYEYTPAIYNGHDYKGTIYQGGKFAGSTLTDKEFEFPGDEQRYSDARDNEIARLAQMIKTETMSNVNTSILHTANIDDANHRKLYNDYSMFADTATLNMRSDNPYFNEEQGIAVAVSSTGENSGGVGVEIEERKHTIERVDFGLIERPETAVVVDKQINDIKIITNDGRIIFDADYDITYDRFTIPVIPGREKDDKIKELKLKTVIDYLGKDFLGRDEYLVANVELKSSSINTDLLQALNKFENKLISITEEFTGGELRTGQANFRFVNVDDTILQGTTVKLSYQYTALNIGETDYTSERIESIQDNVIRNNYEAAKVDNNDKEPTTVYKEYRKVLDEKVEAEKNRAPSDEINIGEYLGSFYYTGTSANTDKLVSTRVRQIIDYVDNDIVFKQEDNLTENHLWRNATIVELKGDGDSANKLISDAVIPEFDILDEHQVRYITPTKNNIVLSSDDLYSTKNDVDDNTDSLVQSNARFERKLIPYDKWDTLSEADKEKESYYSVLTLTVSKTVSSQDDQKTMAYDNLGEVVLLENTVGRRDMATVLGNANPAKGEFEAGIEERDQSATELVTFTPPTGILYEEILRKQSYAAVLAGLVIVTIGIVLIKRKVLKKKEN